MTKKLLKLLICSPCYNEEESLNFTVNRLSEILESLINDKLVSEESKILFVDDGSEDKTWEIIQNASQKNEKILGIKLSRNFGHQYALLAGIEFAALNDFGIITIDSDLQQDENKIPEFLTKYYSGADIVYGVRIDRKTDDFFKRKTAEWFYSLLKKFGVNIIKNHADYRFISSKAAKALANFPESNLFLRGLIPLLGFSSDYVYFEVKERFAGKTKYNLKKMINLALDGITSLSYAPLRFIFFIGIVSFSFSVILIIYAMYIALFTKKAVPGWASTIIPIYLLGGIQLLSLGVIGEYLAKIYLETKRRPRYIIEQTTNNFSINKRQGIYEEI